MTQPAGMVQLESLTANNPTGILLDAWDKALALLDWAHTKQTISCHLYDKIDGTWELRIEGSNIEGTNVIQGQWLVLDGKHFSALSVTEWTNKYKIAGT